MTSPLTDPAWMPSPTPAAGASGRPEAARSTATADDLPVRRAQPPRELVRTVPCPVCSAPAGTWCVRQDGEPRRRNHLPRVELATELRLGQRLELPRTSSPDDARAGTVKARSADPSWVDGAERGVTLQDGPGSDSSR